jgi:hypothetical protein
VSADGSDPREVKQWQRQQAAESDLAAAEEAVKAGQKVRTLVLQYCCETVKCFLLCSRLPWSQLTFMQASKTGRG